MMPALLLIGWSLVFAIAVYNDQRLLASAVVVIGAAVMLGLVLIVTKLDHIAEQIRKLGER